MVCLRCIMMVQSKLELLHIPYTCIELGEVKLSGILPKLKRIQLKKELHEVGLELMEDKRAILIEKIKNVVINMVHYSEEMPNVNFSTFLSQKLHMEYHQLSEIFSKTKGMTIEHYIILQKIERVKELIRYDELSLSEIAYKLHYSSVAHLSHQFKKTTGMTPSQFKKLKENIRKNIDSI